MQNGDWGVSAAAQFSSLINRVRGGGKDISMDYKQFENNSQYFNPQNEFNACNNRGNDTIIFYTS